MQISLSVENIRKTFHLSRKQRKINNTNEKIKIAVNDLSFDAYEGEIYGLLGPNGAGKTTTLRMIATLLTPEAGKITINGFDVIKDVNEVRKIIGFLTSDLRLEEFFTPNYLFDFFSNLHQVPKIEQAKRKKYLFDKFGINEFAEAKVGELSSGMRQKASLAISLVHDPKIIILDEPTNGLDVLVAKVVLDFLQELKAQGKCIIISSHIFTLIEKLCDRVGIIINGKIVLNAPLSEICKDTPLEDVFFALHKQVEGEKL